jgi:hypothetical protein
MNERIKELAEQCWDKRPEGQLHFDNEKFADMIVRECADFIDSHKRVDEYGQACDIIYGEDLMKHFGVES